MLNGGRRHEVPDHYVLARGRGRRPLIVSPYAADLAAVHHRAYGDVALAAAQVLLDELRRRGRDGGLVVDLGCGSGLLARAVTDAGYDVLGVDLSPDMVAIAAETAPAAEFVCGSLFDVDLPSCVAVTSIGECVNYLFDERGNADRVDALFARVHAALAPGGVFLLDVAGPGRVGARGREHVREGDGWTIFVRASEDATTATLTRDILLFEADRAEPDCYRRSHEVHRLRLYPRAEIVGRLRQAGFRVRAMPGYGELRLGRGYAAFLATKPRSS